MLIVLAGPSGSGKTALAAALRDDYSNALPLISYATRRRRDSDKPGEIEFVTPGEFNRMAGSGKFIWIAQPFKSRFRYGTLKTDVDIALADEDHVYLALLTVDVTPILHRHAEATGKLSRLRYLYLFLDDPVELRRRLSLDSHRNNTEARLAAASDENAAAQKMRDVLHFVDAKLPPEDVLERAVHIINFGVRPPVPS